MTTLTIVVQNAPYEASGKSWNALRFAGAALVEDMKVQLHLLGDGVEVGRKNQAVPEGATNLEELISELMECGLEVCACGKSMNDYSLSDAAMIDGIQRSSMKTLAVWVKASDQVLVF